MSDVEMPRPASVAEEGAPAAREIAPPAPPKVAPETLVLRATPDPVARFRRGAVIGLAALCSTGIIGAAWYGLKPATFMMVADSEQHPDAAATHPPDALAKAPANYGDVPKLGPPLPGDLGRPILEQQAAAGYSGNLESSRSTQAADTERQRLETERTAARESGLMVQSPSSSTAVTQPSVTVATDASPAAPVEDKAGQLALDPDRDPNGQQRKLDFVSQNDATGDVNPHALQRAASQWMLSAGSVIAASLVTGLSSDLPGLVVAQVTENAYDSVTGRTVLIPQGSRLIGSYDSVVAFGQKRALLVWQRIILPDGSSIRIDNVPATDAAGYAGLADKVDFHSWALLKGVAMATLLGVGTELGSGSSESDLVRAIRESTQQNADRAGQQITSKNLDIQPTITVRPGWPLRVVVHKDLVLAPWKDGGS